MDERGQRVRLRPLANPEGKAFPQPQCTVSRQPHQPSFGGVTKDNRKERRTPQASLRPHGRLGQKRAARSPQRSSWLKTLSTPQWQVKKEAANDGGSQARCVTAPGYSTAPKLRSDCGKDGDGRKLELWCSGLTCLQLVRDVPPKPPTQQPLQEITAPRGWERPASQKRQHGTGDQPARGQWEGWGRG